MEPGQVCRLKVSERLFPANLAPNVESVDDEDVTVTAVVVATRRHAEDAERLLYYMHCTHIDLSADLARQRKKASAPSWHGVALGAIGSGTMHSCNELRVSTNSFVSADGYHYRYDGWYEATALQCLTEAETIASSASPSDETTQTPSANLKGDGAVLQRRNVPEEWVSAMERDTAVCEVVYLCYAFQPWFPAAYTALQYLALPEEDVCHSVYLCHRCLSPFFTREQYFVHVEGDYCAVRSPPGRLIYHDEETGYKAYLVDGAKNLHYGRCLSLLGKHFIESKLLANDVDLYEYVVVTTPRASLPYYAECGMSAEAFRSVAAHFDEEDWEGDAVMGYFSRLKHHPDHTLSCIVTFPIFQRRRVATFLLDLAYWMTGQRQRLCGEPRCCGSAGGAISRPFSPHGQSLLLSYWRRSLLRALGDVAPRRRASRTAPMELSFTLAELKDMMDVPLHTHDLEMLLLQSEFTFYSAATAGGRDGEVASSERDGAVVPPSSSRKVRREVYAASRSTLERSSSSSSKGRSSPSVTSSVLYASPSSQGSSSAPASPSGQRYVATMVLDSALLDTALERASRVSRRTHAVFDKRWLVKNARGVYAYDLPQFHY